ncbi:MAG: TAXI family TRAP transporter solute-binding subunit, partial [Syntrophothermus sp.]
MKKGLILVLVLAVTMVAGLGVLSQPAGAEQQLVIATGGTAGTYYPLGGALAQIFNSKVKNVNAIAQTTGASVENVRLIGKKEVDIAFVQNDITDYAYNGEEVFKEKLANFGVMASLYPEIVQIVVSADSNIKSVADLKGKKVSVGAAGSGVEANARQILNAYGLTYKDISPNFLSFAESADQFKDKHLDAIFVVAGAPTAAIQDISASRKVRILSIPRQMSEKIQKKYPFFSEITIPANTYSGQTEEVATLAVRAMLIVRKDLDEGLVYNLTKA